MYYIFYNKGKGSLTPDEFFNVVKLQNGVDCTKDEVNIILYIFTGHISLENVFFFQIKKILKPLPTDKDGRIKIEDFLYKDVHSEDAFKVIILDIY